MKLECKHCHTQIEHDDPDIEWTPPAVAGSLGAIVCPKCDKIEDFLQWKVLTDSKAPQPQADE